ncbi:MAG: ribonuclease domain-containing protein [Elusimicrobiales bacterium]
MKKLFLLLSAAIAFSLPAYSGQDISADGALSGLLSLSDASSGAKIPAIPATGRAHVRAERQKAGIPPVGHDAPYNSTCVPSQDIAPGAGFSPEVQDQPRNGAITTLLGRIATCDILPFKQDGTVFTNREGRLPKEQTGWYHEYTLIVPGREVGDGPVPIQIGGKTYMTGTMMSKRGSERVIIGGGKRIFYTPDHYNTFIELKVVR